MRCPKCQSDNPDTKLFCGDCGTQLTSQEDAQTSFTKTLEIDVEEPARGTIFADGLAAAYYAAGEMEKARLEYTEIISLTISRLYYGDIYAKSIYILGKIHEQQGDTAEAIEQYEKFLDLWKDADQGIPEVADAKERVAELVGK